MSDFFEENFQRAVFAPVIKITKNTKKPVLVSDISKASDAVEKKDKGEQQQADENKRTDEKTNEKEAVFGKSIPEVSSIGFFDNSLNRLVKLAEKTGFEVKVEKEERCDNSFFYAITVKKKNTHVQS